MLPPDYLATAPDNIIRLVNQAEEDILCDMARRIVQTGQLTATAQWQAWRLEQLGASQTYIRQQLGRLTGKTQGEINALFQEAGQQALYYDDQIYQAAGLNPGNPRPPPPTPQPSSLSGLWTGPGCSCPAGLFRTRR